MSTPQPNASTPPTVSTPPVIPVPTTPLGAVQTMMSLLSPPVTSQGAPSLHPAPASHPEISSDAPVPASVPPAPASAPTPATYIAANPTFPAPASVSSQGGHAPTPPHGTTRTARYSYPTLPELSHPPPPRPISLPGVNCFRRMTAHYTDSETVRQTRDDRVHVGFLVTTYASSWLADPSAAGASSFDQYPDGSVGARLEPTVDIAEAESKKAARTGENKRRLLQLYAP